MPAHEITCRVFYEDTDAAGIVYYANYLRFAERGRTEMLRAGGFDHRRLREAFDVVLAVKRCTVDYKRPARLDDLLTIETRLVEIAGARLEMQQAVRLQNQLLVSLEITLAILNSELRPRRLPPAVHSALVTAAGWPAAGGKESPAGA